MARKFVDPEVERFYKAYPKFPGVAKCVELLRNPKVKGVWLDIICRELEINSVQNAMELVATTLLELDASSRAGRMLLDVVADSKLIEAFGLFAQLLQSPDGDLRRVAVRGLRQLDTKDARRLLFEAGH